MNLVAYGVSRSTSDEREPSPRETKANRRRRLPIRSIRREPDHSSRARAIARAIRADPHRLLRFAVPAPSGLESRVFAEPQGFQRLLGVKTVIEGHHRVFEFLISLVAL